MPYIPSDTKSALKLLVSLVCLTPGLKAHALSFPTLSTVERYTATGQKDSYSNPCYSKDLGIVSVKDGFIPTLSAFDIICNSGLEEINGKPVMGLAYWSIYNPSNFKRSSKTYSIEGVPYVIILNSSGIPYIRKPIVYLSIPATWDITSEDREGYKRGAFVFELDTPSTQDIKIAYTISGNAINGKDYEKITAYKIMPAGKNFDVVYIAPIDDLKKEKIEKVTIKLKANTKLYKIDSTSTKALTVQILDND